MKGFLALLGTVLIFLMLSCSTKPTNQLTPEIPSPTTISIPTSSPTSSFISGKVVDSQGVPSTQATVRIQATGNQAFSSEDGSFVLANLEIGVPVTVSAWKDGYYCAKVETVTPPAAGITLTLRLVQTNDNPDYQWIAPTGENSCYSCKPGVTQVWLEADAHGRSATNIRFLSMYNGTDVKGNQSPLTRFANSRDYGIIPLPPDLTKPYYGPGYKLDFPTTAGNCAACHIPGAAIDAPYGTDPNEIMGVNAFGIHCDFCHKVADVRLDPTTQLPYPNMPGVLSQDIRRPFPEDTDRYQIFFGSFDDDNVPMEDTYLPLIKESQWCAPCHYGVFWNTVIYNSYGEWLDSPYSDPQTGKTCQKCHMPAPTILDGQVITNVAPGKSGVERDPSTIPAHTFQGASNLELLQNAISMNVSSSKNNDELVVTVTIVNDKTGHSVPTDSPLRQMILLVQAYDAVGNLLIQEEGPTIPDYGGVGDSDKGYYAGLPGKVYAKILAELWTEVTPTGAYWNPVQVVSDNRLAAFEADISTYIFTVPKSGQASIDIKLLYRRAFIELMDQKGWEVADILMAEKQLAIP